MGLIRPEDLTWGVTLGAQQFFRELRTVHGESWYEGQVTSLRILLCRYFQSSERCDQALGRSIRPVGSATSGAKRLKVRWGLPGRGRSGGLRPLVHVRCAERKVVVAGAGYRADEPAF